MMKSSRYRNSLRAGTAIVIVVGARAAVAEDAPTQNATLDEIIVTAEHRSEKLEDVPMSIVAVDNDALTRAGVTNIQELGRIAPGVQINFGGSNTQPAIRGITTLTNGPGIENNVAVYIDGFYEPNSIFINMDFANISNIEVLKGPQGTLYGRNSTGGAILINTLQPTDKLSGKVEGSYGRFNDRTFDGYLSGPITDRIRFSVAGYFRNSDGYLKLIANPLTNAPAGDAAPLTQHAVRAKLDCDLTDNLTATLGYNYALSVDARGQLFTPFAYVPAFLPGPPLRASQIGTESFNDVGDTTLRSESHQATLTLQYNTSIGTLTSHTGYTWHKSHIGFDFDGTFADIVYFITNYHEDTFQQAVDYAIKFGNFDLTAGGLYYHDRFAYDQPGSLSVTTPATTGVRTVVNTTYDDLGTRAAAGYLDGTYHITPLLSVDLGGRYSWENRDILQSVTDATGAYTIVPTYRDVTFSKFTPRASIRYEIAPRASVYASWTRGFRSGTFNVAAPASPALIVPTRPENVDAYEVGIKLLRTGVRFDAAAFYYNYTDINASLLVPSPLCAGVPNCHLIASIFSNAKGAHIKGIDGQVTFTPVNRLNIRLGGAWLQARYTDFKNAIGTELNPVTQTNVSGQTQDWSGYQMARAPNFSGNLDVDYVAQLAAGSLLLTGGASFTDGYVVSNPSLYCSASCTGGLEATQRYRTNGYTLLNASMTWIDPSGHFSIGILGKNLSNKFYRATYNGAVFGDYSVPGEPRTYGVKVGYTL